ncbi:MAG: hypothetical protein ACPGWM_08315, partial [Flavobacteriales bacterium]
YDPQNPPKNQVVRFFRKNVVKPIVSAVAPAETNTDKFINEVFGTENSHIGNWLGELHLILAETAFRYPQYILRKDKLVKIWEKLKNCNLNDDAELRSILKVPETKEGKEFLERAKEVTEYFKFYEQEAAPALKKAGTSFNGVLETLTVRNSGTRAIRDFAVFPFLGSLMFNGGRFFMDAGLTQGAQAAFLGGTALTSAPSFLIADSVVKHLDYKHIENRYVQALVPLLKIGTILSHTFSPILNMMGIAFDFDGMVNGKSNAFGKVNNFITTAFDLLRPLSMLGFALGHLSGLNHVNADHGELDTSKRGLFGSKVYKAKPGEKNFFKYAHLSDKFGFWANMIGFGFWGVSQIASLVIENHEKKVNAMFEPIINELQRRMAMEQEVLKQAVLDGKISKEEAIAHLEESEKAVQGFIKQKLLPAYDKMMEGWKTASWLVNVINWASFLGVSIQMYTGSFRGLLHRTTKRMDGLVKADGTREASMGFREAFFKTAREQTGGDTMKRIRLWGGLAVGPFALVFGSLIEGISTIFGQDSPFA